MSTARRHHYVAQCYLKAFAVSRGKNQQTLVFDARTRRTYPTSLANVAVEQDFNRIDVGDHPPDALEKALADFESEVAQALRSIIAAQSLSNENDRATLLNFMCLLAIRNPRFRETFRQFHSRVAHAIMNISLATPERWERQVAKARDAGFIDGPDVAYEDMKTFLASGAYKMKTTTSYHSELEFSAFESTLATFFQRRWILVQAPSKSGGFITSDHPVCLLATDQLPRPMRLGYGMASTEVLFPISPELGLIGTFEDVSSDCASEGAVVAEAFVANFNRAIVSGSEWHVYARDHHFMFVGQAGLVRKASRLLDDPLFKRPRR